MRGYIKAQIELEIIQQQWAEYRFTNEHGFGNIIREELIILIATFHKEGIRKSGPSVIIEEIITGRFVVSRQDKVALLRHRSLTGRMSAAD